MKFTRIAIVALALLVAGSAHARGGFKARLLGANEVPPVETEALGLAKFRFNRELTYMSFSLFVRGGVGLLGANGAHLHCAPAGENGPVIAALAGEVMPGFDGRLLIRSGLTDANITGDTVCGSSLADLAHAILDGSVYVNVHSADFPAGEVRGQIRHDNRKKDDEPDD